VKSLTVSRWERGVQRISPTVETLLQRLVDEATANGDATNRTAADVRSNRSAGPDGYDAWEPNPALRSAVPDRAYQVALGYLQRMVAAKLDRDQIEEAERLMLDNRYAKANSRAGRELSEDDHILLIDATWDIIREVAGWQGKVL